MAEVPSNKNFFLGFFMNTYPFISSEIPFEKELIANAKAIVANGKGCVFFFSFFLFHFFH